MNAPAVLDHDRSATERPTPPVSGLRLDPDHEAHEPPEARGVARDGVRLMVSREVEAPQHARFGDLAQFVEPGDLLVVNTSGTVAAAVDGVTGAGAPVVVHVSNTLPGGLWLVEVRQPGGRGDGTSDPLVVVQPDTVHLDGGATFTLLAPFARSRRLWVATFEGPEPAGGESSLTEHLRRHGRPIRYRHVPREWPIEDYQTIFATEPGSAEMPSASRPFTDRVVASLVRRGALFAPLLLHTGVSSLEGSEDPYPERYRVPSLTAGLVNAAHDRGSRVIAIGTTVVRALETVTDDNGTTHPGEGWTELVVSPRSGIRAVDGLLTGWHEPEASHLWMLEAVAGRRPLELAYGAAFEADYLWHEFGDSHLLLPYRGGR